jgi:hypothetical protein
MRLTLVYTDGIRLELRTFKSRVMSDRQRVRLHNYNKAPFSDRCQRIRQGLEKISALMRNLRASCRDNTENTK